MNCNQRSQRECENFNRRVKLDIQIMRNFANSSKTKRFHFVLGEIDIML